MKKHLLLLAFLIFPNVLVVAQEKKLFFGPILSRQRETREVKIYGPAGEIRKSERVISGFGLKGQYFLNKNTSLEFGLLYINKVYAMVIPFNHCAFNKIGEPCSYIYGHVKKYNYNLLELPVSFNKHASLSKKLGVYLGLGTTAGFKLKASYSAYIPDIGRKSIAKLNYFSQSLNFQTGIGYKVNNNFRLIVEPSIRWKYKQKADRILLEKSDWSPGKFSNLGINFIALVTLN